MLHDPLLGRLSDKWKLKQPGSVQQDIRFITYRACWRYAGTALHQPAHTACHRAAVKRNSQLAMHWFSTPHMGHTAPKPR